jgi:hypothetical protein
MICSCGNDVIPTDVFQVIGGVTLFPSVFGFFPVIWMMESLRLTG